MYRPETTRLVWSANPGTVPILALTFWSLNGLALVFLIAFPSELLREYRGRYAILVVFLLFSGLYNAPLLTGQVLLDDIILIGLFLTIVYYRTRNSSGLVVTYVLNEAPVWYAVGIAYGEPYFLAGIVFRAGIGVCCLSAILVPRLKHKPPDGQRSPDNRGTT